MNPEHAKYVESLDFTRRPVTRVVIPLLESVLIVDRPSGIARERRDVGMIIFRTDGTETIIPPDKASIVLNDGVLNRLGVPIEVTRQLDHA